MACPDADRDQVIATSLTIIQLRAELLRRQPRRRDVAGAEKSWLDAELEDIVAATRVLAARLAESRSVDRVQRGPHGPTLPLIALERFSRN
jgi:hypothetical protein